MTAPVGAGLHGERPANDAGAVIHDPQAHALTLGARGRKSDAIVAYGDFDPGALLNEPHVDEGSLGMLERVIDGFLHHPIGVRSHLGIEGLDRLGADQDARAAVDLFNRVRQLAQGHGQALLLDVGRVEAAGPRHGVCAIACSTICPTSAASTASGPLSRLKITFQLGHAEPDTRKELPQAVVQILPDASLFSVTDLENFLLQALTLSDIVG